MDRNKLISNYSHLNRLPRENEALHSLKRIASLVKPIMRARNWKVGTLAEFFPSEHNLLGINMNHGERICLRLRSAMDKRQFLPFEQIVDTMLHELCHNVFGPHNTQFYALWDQLRLEYQGLLKKGYTGEGLLSEGRRLGGWVLEPMHEAKEIARRAANAAERRRKLNSASSQKLGGFPIPTMTDIRDIIVDAIQRRTTVLNGCAADRKNQKEIENIVVQATKNGFASQAEEDEANERAISQALWELVQEDIAKQNSESHSLNSINITDRRWHENNTSETPKIEKQNHPNFQTWQSNSRLLSLNTSKNLSTTLKNSSKKSSANRPESKWDCPFCTLYNPISFLACEACNKERPIEVTKRFF